MNIVIVESPAKAKTINQYLGNDYKVISSVGHFRGLPNKDGSILPEEDFLMKYYHPNLEKLRHIPYELGKEMKLMQ